MYGKICRRYYETQTEGELELYNEDTHEIEFKCKTLELPWIENLTNISCIPEGFYDVVPRTSAKYKKHFHVTDVEGRSFILIHHGNYAGSDNPNTGRSDIRGCILVGKSHIDLDGDGIKEVTNSKWTMEALLEVAPDGFVLEITQ